MKKIITAVLFTTIILSCAQNRSSIYIDEENLLFEKVTYTLYEEQIIFRDVINHKSISLKTNFSVSMLDCYGNLTISLNSKKGVNFTDKKLAKYILENFSYHISKLPCMDKTLKKMIESDSYPQSGN